MVATQSCSPSHTTRGRVKSTDLFLFFWIFSFWPRQFRMPRPHGRRLMEGPTTFTLHIAILGEAIGGVAK